MNWIIGIVCFALIAIGIWWLKRYPISDPNVAIQGKDFEEAVKAHETAMKKSILKPSVWDRFPNRRASDLGKFNGKGWE
jgi:hypothetical protein